MQQVHNGRTDSYFKTAKAPGVAVPLSLLGRADQVIE
jgi:hypothetical protein